MPRFHAVQKPWPLLYENRWNAIDTFNASYLFALHYSCHSKMCQNTYKVIQTQAQDLFPKSFLMMDTIIEV